MQNTTMTRRQWIGAGVSVGAALGMTASAQQPQQLQRNSGDPVLTQLLVEQIKVITEIQKNNHRITADTARRLAIPLRTLDALHIALAISGQANALITFDSRMAEAAALYGLTVVQSPAKS